MNIMMQQSFLGVGADVHNQSQSLSWRFSFSPSRITKHTFSFIPQCMESIVISFLFVSLLIIISTDRKSAISFRDLRGLVIKCFIGLRGKSPN